MTTPHLLLVDDEANVLNALRRELQDDYSLEAFSSPHEALQRCRDTRFDLAIADYRMPEMDGVEFLRNFSKLQPDAMRLMLSGQADFDALVGTINEAHIYRFLNKPWDSAALMATLSEALTYRRRLLENRHLAENARLQHPWQPAPNPDRLYQVLVVDDEPRVLNALSRELSARGGWSDLHMAMLYQTNPALPQAHRELRFNIHTTTSPMQALERAERVDSDVVIVDYLMPEMDGLRFFDAFREIQPDAVRILLSGHANTNTLEIAINHTEVYGYIGKPWSEYTLKNTVSRAVSYRDLLRENRRLAEQARLRPD